MFSGTLYYAGKSKTFYKRGDAYSNTGASTLYIQVATNVYQKYNGSTLYYSGGSETVTLLGDEYTSPLYEPGSTFEYKEQGDLLETALFYQGKEYSGGLYTDFELATMTTRDVTALTIGGASDGS